jgi:hypothetical protein
VLEALAWLAANRDGWVNLLPGVEEDTPVEAPGLFSFFGPQQPPVSMCTWMPPGRGRHGVEEVTVGILHPFGKRVVRELADGGIGVPSQWRVAGDHPRRGLIVRVPLTVSNSDVLTWTLAAGEYLCPIPMTGMWEAHVYLPIT